jgi:hypothetical protein
MSPKAAAVGAYGFSVVGLAEHQSALLNPVPETWPLLTVETVTGPNPATHRYVVGDDYAEYCTLDQTGQKGGMQLIRHPLVARFTSPSGFSPDAMIHPDLGVIGAIASRWQGRHVFHAGAFVANGRAWILIGHKEAGKSSLLGQLAAREVEILADDAVVIDETGAVLIGPRCIDLREGAAARLALGTDIGLVGTRRRWRVSLPSGPAEVPLGGWVVPSWGDTIAVDAVPLAERPPLLLGHRYLEHLVPPHPAQVLSLAARPVLRFGRPRRWQVADRAADALLEAVRHADRRLVV